MAGNLDIVGGVGVDVVPVIPNFHQKLRDIVLPIADKVGAQAGKDMGDKMAEAIGATLRAKLPQVISSAITVAGSAAQKSATRQGEQTGGAFARSLKAKLEAAFRAMPKLDIKISDTGVDAELARLRARLETLSGKRIGIDVSAEAARAEVDRIEAKLIELGAQHPNVAVRADTAVARAALAEFRAEIDAVDAKSATVRVKADTSQAQGALLALAIQIGILTAIPAVPVLAAGIGAIGSAAVASAAGVGSLALVAIPAIKGISAALQAKTAAEKQSTSATNSGANAAVQAQQRALSMAGAQQALAAAHRNAARSIAQANQQVATAERAVADAVTRAAEQRKAAADGVRSAEQSLADAQRTARQAEVDLMQARVDAAKQLRDLNNQLADGALNQRDAALAVAQTQEELAAVLANPLASNFQVEQAQLAYDRAVQNQKEQKTSYADLQKSAAAQKKAGVDGSDAVKTATQKLADAQRNVVDQTRALADAQANVAKVAKSSAQSIADAQQNVVDAVQNAADAQVSAAESVASAERGVQSARLSGLSTVTTATSKTDAYQKALAKLSPSARDLFDAIAGPKGLSKAFKDWSTSLQPEVLPLFTRGVNGAKNSLPSFTPIVHAAADAVKILMDRASASLKSPFWKGFKDDIANSAEPAIVGLGVSFGNLIAGMAGIVDAFLPHMDGISTTMQRITRRFSNWGKGLKGSPDFERFLQYAKDNAPRLGELLGNILGAVADVSKALAPLSTAMFGVLNPIIDGVSWIATNLPGVIQTLWGLYAVNKAIEVGMAAFAIAMGFYDTAVALAAVETWSWAAAIQATGIVPLIELIVLAVAALVLGIIEAYKHVGWFQTAVDATWTAIKVATIFLWEKVLKPAFDGIWWAMKGIGDIAVWLWQTAIGPAFRFIWEAAKILATILIILVIGPMYLGFKVLGGIALWLWSHAFKPAFQAIAESSVQLWKKYVKPVLGWIGDAIAFLWKHFVEPNFKAMKMIFRALGDVGMWLWKNALKPVFGWIADGAEILWKVGIKPWFDLLKKGVGLVADAFGVAKDEIGKQWKQLKDIAKTPIKFIIDHVYNNGIVPLWNSVAGITGAGKLKKMDLKGFATGGIMSGYSPGRDDRIIAVGGGEAVMRPEWTRAVGADRINAWNAAARSGGVGGVQRAIGHGMPAFAGGGIVDWFKSAASSVGNAITTGADFLAHPGKIFESAKKFLTNTMKSIAKNKWSEMAVKLPLGMLSGLKDKALSFFTGGGGASAPSSAGGSGGSGVARWGSTVLEALSLIHQPASWKNTVLRRMNQESGGNPNIVNRWDSNWLAGHPSVGLMQVIGPTFRANAGKFRNTGPFMYGTSVNPLANVYAGLNYAMHRYHSLSALNRPGGYDSGGYLPTGTSLVYNHTGKPEPVFTGTQWDDIRAAKGGSGPTTVQADVRVFVGDREITDIVRTEVTAHEASTASAINDGRWI